MYSTAPSATVPTYLPQYFKRVGPSVHCIARLRPCALRVRLHIARARALRCQHLCAGAYADTVRARACACTALVLRTVLLVRRLGLVSVGSVCHIGASLLSVGSSFVRLCGCALVCLFAHDALPLESQVELCFTILYAAHKHRQLPFGERLKPESQL